MSYFNLKTTKLCQTEKEIDVESGVEFPHPYVEFPHKADNYPKQIWEYGLEVSRFLAFDPWGTSVIHVSINKVQVPV